MRKRSVAVILATLLVIVLAVPASAITNGRPDGSDHPYVGLVVSFDANMEHPQACSGSLIAPKLFLTAGHCLAGSTYSFVFFDQQVPMGSTLGSIPGTPHVHPRFGQRVYGGNGVPSLLFRDVGVVQLDTPAPVARTAELPPVGLVDELRNKAAVDFVGYGVTHRQRIPGRFLKEAGPYPPPYYRWDGALTRMQANAQLVSRRFRHSADFLRMSQNASQDKGGVCYGDSGGPDLRGGTDMVLGVNSYGLNANCAGHIYSSRIDIGANANDPIGVLPWIRSFLP